MNTHHITIKNLDSFINSRKECKDLILGFDISNQCLCNFEDKDSIIKIGNIPSWRRTQDILDIMFNNIMSNSNVKIDNDGLYFKSFFMKWGD